MLSFFLADQNSHHWEQVQKLASTPSTDTAANKSLRQYVLEAQRMTSNQQNIRICTGETTVGDQQIKPGQLVVCSMVR